MYGTYGSINVPTTFDEYRYIWGCAVWISNACHILEFVTIGGLCLHLCEVHYICCHMLANLAKDYLRCAYTTLTIAEHMHDCNLFADRTPSLPQDVLHGCIESESDTGLKKLVMRPS